MAGPNLEVFKFGLYLFFPLAVMIHYGDPDWYKKNVLPLRDEFWPKESTLFKPPRNTDDLRSTREDMRAERLARRQQRLDENRGPIESAAAAATAKAASLASSSSVSGRTGSMSAGVLRPERDSSSPSDSARRAHWDAVDRERMV